MAKLVLPKEYLSYSSLSLWKDDKPKFRRKYYENIQDKDTVYTIYGKVIHSLIEKDDKYKNIRLPVAEQKMQIKIKDVPIIGYIDTFDPVTHDFAEYKSGIAKPDGSPRWDQVAVERHVQLPFYSFLIQQKYGTKVNKTFLVWLETRFKDNTLVIGGVKLGGERELELTGRHEIFHRKLYQYDRDWVEDWIIKSAKEISEDYQTWLSTSAK